jgi:hypothetical protein
MPRLFASRKISIWLVAALLLAAGTTAVLRAEQPANPLRSLGTHTSTLRIVPVPSDPPIVLSSLTAADPPVEPQSAPPHLGQPELLPPAGAEQAAGAGFSPPDLHEEAPFQQFVHPWFEEPWFSHGDPNDPLRHIGIGQPLTGTSWRNRPHYFGTFVGGIMMDDLVSGQIYQNDTTFVGARLGYDFDHFWGLEGRWGFARPDLADSNGTPFFPANRSNLADVSLVYYPLGDARWRPYLAAGLGFQTSRFNDDLGQRISEATLEIPLACGIKYFYGPWFTLRFDFVDNLTLGNARISGMHNIGLMAGAEVRFGGRRPSYFPWHNSTTYW